MKNWNPLWTWVAVFVLVDSAIFTAFRLGYGHQNYGVVAIAMAMAFTYFIQLIVYSVLLSNAKTKLYGKALGIATLLMLLIGFGICTL